MYPIHFGAFFSSFCLCFYNASTDDWFVLFEIRHPHHLRRARNAWSEPKTVLRFAVISTFVLASSQKCRYDFDDVQLLKWNVSRNSCTEFTHKYKHKHMYTIHIEHLLKYVNKMKKKTKQCSHEWCNTSKTDKIQIQYLEYENKKR